MPPYLPGCQSAFLFGQVDAGPPRWILGQALFKRGQFAGSNFLGQHGRLGIGRFWFGDRCGFWHNSSRGFGRHLFNDGGCVRGLHLFDGGRCGWGRGRRAG